MHIHSYLLLAKQQRSYNGEKIRQFEIGSVTTGHSQAKKIILDTDLAPSTNIKSEINQSCKCKTQNAKIPKDNIQN